MGNSCVSSKYKISVWSEEKNLNLVQAAIDGDHKKISGLLKSIDASQYNKLSFHTSENYMTPLHIAAAYGHITCVQILIKHGANVNAEDRLGATALHMAAEKGNYPCLKALLEAGADCCLPTKFSKSGHFNKKQDKTALYLGFSTPLHLATANNHVECVEELINCGADCNAIDEWGRTSLHIAAEYGFSKCILAHRNNVGRVILSSSEFKNYDTPLHLAVLNGMVNCVRELLYLGSDAYCLNDLLCSPLQLALKHSESTTNGFEILKLLILEGHNTDVNIKLNSYGFQSLLHYVCFKAKYGSLRRSQIAQFLIAYGADVNIKHDGIRLLEIELTSVKENDILCYIVRSLLQLPHLVQLRYWLNESDVFSSEEANGWRQIDSRFSHFGYPFGWDCPIGSWRYFSFDFTELSRDQTALKPSVLEKIMWYEKLASNPRTLQHCCRYVIRQTLGSFRMKHVNKLPIPPELRLYVLLECD